MKKIIFLTILLIALVGCAKESAEVPAVTGQVILSLPVNEEYILDTENSLLTWEASRIGIKHTGTVAIKEGSLIRENDEFTKGEFIIDMTTITETKNNQRFLNHIKSKDFFDVDKYPISTLIIKSITEAYTITADLTIMDQTNEISFPARVSTNNGKLHISADFEIDRTQWGITYGSGSFFENLGDKAIKDKIKYGLELVFN